MKRVLSIVLSLILVISAVFSTPFSVVNVKADDQVMDLNWLICIYMCGSDLESGDGSASDDLYEMVQNVLPDDCAILIETGGSQTWYQDFIDPSVLSRFLIYQGEVYLLETQPLASMGDSSTFQSFLQYADDHFNAQKKALIMWNHGGGVLGGICADELYEYDTLSLSEVEDALASVFTSNNDSPYWDIIGFDACLMAAIDTAAILQGYAHYMVASEETESGYGWDYDAITASIAKNPSIDPLELTYDICNSFYAFLETVRDAETATLSVTDLTKLSTLLEAYDAFGLEALNAAATDSTFFTELTRISSKVENYGGNSKETGYYNLCDLGNLASSVAWMLPSAQSVLDALNECVVYLVKGSYRSQSTGLSCYYVYDYDMSNLDIYMQEGYSSAFMQLYNYQLSGTPSSEMVDLLDGVVEEADIIQNEKLDSWVEYYYGISAGLTDEGYASFDFGEEMADTISDADFALYYYDEEHDIMYLMGYDNDYYADWDSAYFEDNFRGVWGAIDGIPVYMDLNYCGDDYNLYDVPVMVNDVPATLQVAYDYEYADWYVLGWTPDIGSNGNNVASKEMYHLEVGDIVTVLYYLAQGDEEFDFYMGADIEITEDSYFGEAELPDGLYYEVFCFYDYTGGSIEAAPITFEIEDGEIYTYES